MMKKAKCFGKIQKQARKLVCWWNDESRILEEDYLTLSTQIFVVLRSAFWHGFMFLNSGMFNFMQFLHKFVSEFLTENQSKIEQCRPLCSERLRSSHVHVIDKSPVQTRQQRMSLPSPLAHRHCKSLSVFTRC